MKNIGLIPVQDIVLWQEVRREDPYSDEHERIPVPGLVKSVREKTVDGEILSAGVFFWRTEPAFVAWGRKSDEVCGQHAIVQMDGTWSAVIPGCPDFTIIKNKKNEAAGFSLGVAADRMLWSESGRSIISGVSAVSFAEKIKTFLPLIIAFTLVGVFATALLLGGHHRTAHEFMRFFMAGFFLLFGGLKVANLRRFAEMYATYDLLTKRFRAYGYAYPFIELALGVLYLLGMYLYVTNIVTVTIMSLGAVGIFIALRSGKTLECACLGTLFSLPLTTVTLVENLAMALMAAGMILTGYF